MGRFAKKAREVTAKRCVVGRFIEDFDDDDAAELKRLSQRREWGAIIASTEGAFGFHAIKKHATGVCVCTGDDVPGKGVLHG